MAEAMVDEGKLAGHVAEELEAHPAARRHRPRLDAANRRASSGPAYAVPARPLATLPVAPTVR